MTIRKIDLKVPIFKYIFSLFQENVYRKTETVNYSISSFVNIKITFKITSELYHSPKYKIFRNSRILQKKKEKENIEIKF